MAKDISISRDYTTTPGARYRKDGKYSGEDFREKYLEPLFNEESDEEIVINLDGVEGYSTAFLEEVFGGLVRLFGKKVVLKRIKIISYEEPLLINEIENYIDKAIK